MAQILVALSGLGIDGSKDARFLKNRKSPALWIIQYYLPEGGFMHVAANAGNNGGGIGGMLDGMATEQGFYATVAYQRLLDGRSFIYDMHDIELTPGKKVETSQNGGTDEKQKNRKKPKRKTIIKKITKQITRKKTIRKIRTVKKRRKKRIRRVKRSRQALPMLQKDRPGRQKHFRL